jgi:integrase
MAVRLTKTLAEKVKCDLNPDGAPKETTVWDSTVRGFGVRVMPSGHKSWIVSYRVVGVRQSRKVALGSCEALTVEQARDLAANYVAAGRAGRDLRQDIKSTNQANEAARKAKANVITTAGAVEQYLAGYENRRSRRTGEVLSESTIRSERNGLRPLAELEKPLDEVSEQDVVDMLEGQTAALQHTRFSSVRRFYKWALKQRLATQNPTALMDVPPPPKAREECPKPHEMRRIIETALQLAADKKLARSLADVVIVSALTGCRRGEAAAMRWENVDLDEALWEQPSYSNKSRRVHRVPLPPKVVELLRGRWEAAGWPTTGLCMPSPRTGGVASSTLTSVMDAIRTATGFKYRLHDMRRGIASGLADAGVPIAVADALLNHAATATRGGVISVYQRSDQLPQRREALEIWEQLVFSAGKVVPFKRSA